jgi:DNA-binding MarR family transcriptional regulator
MTSRAPQASLLHLLHWISQCAATLFGRNVEALTPRQFVVHEAVAQEDGLSQTDIMAATGIDRSSTAVLVRQLVTKDWLLQRRSRRDARLYVVRLTASGRESLAVAETAARSMEQSLCRLPPPSHQKMFGDTLQLMLCSCLNILVYRATRGRRASRRDPLSLKLSWMSW